MKFIKLILVTSVLFVFSCEQEITPEDNGLPPEIVVEGYIEAGEIPLPPIVVVTRSFPFRKGYGADEISGFFVNDALITVSDGDQTVTLEEVCWDQLTEDQQKAALENFDIGFDSLAINVCLYTDLTLSMLGEEGKTYELSVLTPTAELFSTTTIPPHVTIDSLFMQPRAGDNSLNYQELIGIISDPESEVNFYRYFTSVNEDRFRRPITSVTDDLFFDGQTFEFPLSKAEPPEDVVPTSQYGLYDLGDTIVIRWLTLDEAHFNFWSTLEFNRLNQGPFASYTRIESNITGGLGVWGGYSNSYYSIIVE